MHMLIYGIQHISNGMSLLARLHAHLLQSVLVNRCCSEYEQIKVLLVLLACNQNFMSAYE